MRDDRPSLAGQVAKTDASMIGFGAISKCLRSRDFQPDPGAPAGGPSDGGAGVSQPPPSARKRAT